MERKLGSWRARDIEWLEQLLYSVWGCWMLTGGIFDAMVFEGSLSRGLRADRKVFAATQSSMIFQGQVRLHPFGSFSITRFQSKMVSNGRAAEDRPTQ